jgi:hypothetical protein
VFDLDGPASTPVHQPICLSCWGLTPKKHGCLTLFRPKPRILPSLCARGEEIGMSVALPAMGSGRLRLAWYGVTACHSSTVAQALFGISGRNDHARQW